MNASADNCHVRCTTCAPFDTWAQRNKAYNIFCERLMEKLDEDGKHPNQEHKDLLIFATYKWRALLPKHSECLALLNNTAHGAYKTYPIDLPEWVRSG